MQIVGYSDRFSVRPGQTIRFMVSCEKSTYRATMVRLRHTDANPCGPGRKVEALTSAIDGTYPGRPQAIHPGSYAAIPHHPILNCPDGFCLQAWIYPTTPQQGRQGLLGNYGGDAGYGLFINEGGALELRIGFGDRVEKVSTGVALTAAHWYFVTASYDAASGEIRLHQRRQAYGPAAEATIQRTIAPSAIDARTADFLIAARGQQSGEIDAHFNGKIDHPRLYDRALTDLASSDQRHLVADWDFARDIGSDRISDIGPHHLHGRAVNLPTRAVTGHNWTGDEDDFKAARTQYGAIHFHDDDLEDAGWEVAFEWSPPADCASGFYAVHLQTDDAEDYLPFVVVPQTPRARIAFLAPTLTYLIYADQRFLDPMRDTLGVGQSDSATPQDQYMEDQRLLSCYDLHSDGTGVCYTTRLRPIPNFRPFYRMPPRSLAADCPRLLNADLHLLDWLDGKGYDYDVITDDELHAEGEALLAPYSAVLTGGHPEYWTAQMLAGMAAYQADGGRLMYLGGNGFYWITSFDPTRPHIAEVRRWRGSRAWDAAPGESYHSTTGEMGGLWRYRNRAPQKMLGIGFISQGSGCNRPYRRQPDSFDPRAAFIFAGIDDDELIGDFPALILKHGAGGFEIDCADTTLGTPGHALVLATASGFSDLYQVALETQLASAPNTGGSQNEAVRCDMVYFEGPNGGAVFSVGSISWNSCLSYNGGDNNVARITENVLRRFMEKETP